MEVILAFFKVLSSFTIDILYDTSIINSLFEFDVDQNLHLIRNKYKLKLKGNNLIINNNKETKNPIINEPENKNPNNNNNINNDNEKSLIDKISIVSNKKLNENNRLTFKDNLNSLSTSKNLVLNPKKRLKKINNKKKDKVKNAYKKNKVKKEIHKNKIDKNKKKKRKKDHL